MDNALQGFAAFKHNVQEVHEDRDKLARAAGKFKNQRMGLAFETWKQHTQHKQLLQSHLSQAVAALTNRSLRAGFMGWREAAAVRKAHQQKVCTCAHVPCLHWLTACMAGLDSYQSYREIAGHRCLYASMSSCSIPFADQAGAGVSSDDAIVLRCTQATVHSSDCHF